MNQVKRIVASLGGRRSVSEMCGVTYHAVFKWEKIGYIPSWHINKLKLSENEKNILLDLYLAHSQEKNQ